MKNTYIGAGFDLGVHIDGASKGAHAILKEIKGEKVFFDQAEDYVKSHDLKDRKKNFDALYHYTKMLYGAMSFLDKDKFVTMVGGDHALAVPSILSSVKRNGKLGLIWIDAHTDYHTMDSTTSGNLHGLPCACVNGFGANDLFDYHDGDFIDPSNTVIIGARSVDDGEIINLKKSGAHVYSMEDVYTRGIENILNEAFDIALKGTNGVHVSYDLDFLDPCIAPGVSTAVPEGANREVFDALLQGLKEKKKEILSFDLVEYNPLNDVDDKTKKLALTILEELAD